MRRFILSCVLVACGGGSNNAPPAPVATNGSPSATASSVANAPVQDAAVVEPPKPHEPSPLVARPAGAVCTWHGATAGSIALRGDATGDVLARFDHAGAPMHLFLAPSGAFVEIDEPHAKVHAFVHNPLGLRARHDIAIGDVLTLKQGAEPEVTLDGDKLMVTTQMKSVAFKGDLPPRGKLFAILGTRPVDLYAQTSGSPVAVAHDDAAEVVEQQGAWTKLMLEDDSVRVTAWAKTSSVTISRDNAAFLAAKVNNMQMQMLGALGGGASTVGAKAQHAEKRECTGDVTVYLRKHQTLVPIARLSRPALALHAGGVVDLPAGLGITLEPGITAAIDSRDEAICR